MMQRRQLLRNALGLSSVGVLSVATGLPVGFLRQPLAHAEGEDADMIDPDRAQYMILSARDLGDPFNANTPGTYGVSGVVHAGGPDMTATAMTLGATATTAAKVWSTLPQWALDRASFMHHSTKTQVHGHLVKVLQLLGDAYRSETIPSIFAKYLAPVLGTVSTTPVPVGAVNMTFNGRTLPQLKPTTLKELLVASDSPLNDLQGLRDQALDEIHLLLRQHGNAEQRKFLNEHSNARADVRKLSEGAADLLSAVDDDSPMSQVYAAVALIKLKLTPVVAIAIPFGSDNHADQGFTREIDEHVSGVGTIATLMNLLESNGLQDNVTFASMNVFGRTLKKTGTKGRTHHSRHHCTMMIGRNVNGSVIGGIKAAGDDFDARPIDSMTGAASDGGDISYEEGLPSVAKTMGAALGLTDATLDYEILKGKVITAALADA
ncbi:MAG: DUF1501 domain-containing protein [Deltaproteobacteria bacterium]|nr:DUF1501 domain-containing protein [Deltaproteobacteria bacterium]MBK8717021.1 DUF1501 domain-containing protein [Deltaproteobacteria bacterium]MBP7290614.1 DUF1501 domain-containing protein [Nannocystaceae bacterium]